MTVTPWYFRPFYVYLIAFAVSFLLFFLIKATRMQGTGQRTTTKVLYWLLFAVGLALLWFNEFEIGPAFWLGLGLLVLAQTIYAFGYAAMRAHPEKKQLVDWGIYRLSRHSHLLASALLVLGVVIMAWNPGSIMYLALWLYFASYLVFTHLAAITEERVNKRKLGEAYEEYIRRVPRYFWK